MYKDEEMIAYCERENGIEKFFDLIIVLLTSKTIS